MSTRYIDSSDAAFEEIKRERGIPFVTAMSIELTDEIKMSMDPGPAARTGVEATVPGTKTRVTRSAAGENPAVIEGTLRDSFHAAEVVVDGDQVRGGTETALKTDDGEHFMAELLNLGTTDGTLQPRPFVDYTLERMAQRHGGRVVAADASGGGAE